jgi:hypothetical protein
LENFLSKSLKWGLDKLTYIHWDELK